MNIKTDLLGSKINNFQRIATKRAEELTKELSTGKRINSASDDSAGLSISVRMNAKSKGEDKSLQNVENSISQLQTVEGKMDTVTSILQRLRELGVQSQNGTYQSSDKSNIEQEKNQLLSTINSISKEVEIFNKDEMKLKINGYVDTVEILNNDYPNFENVGGYEITIQNPEKGVNANYIFAATQNYRTYVYYDSGTGSARIQFGNPPKALGGEKRIDDGKKHTISVFWENDLVKMYIDGEKQGEITFTQTTPIAPKAIIAGHYVPSNYYQGGNFEVSEFRQWGEIKTEEDIKRLANKEVDGSESGLLNAYDFTQNTGSTIVSKTGSGVNANVIGGTWISDGEQSFQIHDGPNNDNSRNISYESPQLSFLQLDSLNLGKPDSLSKLDQAIDKVSKERGYIGSTINQLGFTKDNLNSSTIQTKLSESRISDADISQTSMEMLKNDITVQTIYSMINKNKEIMKNALSLFNS